MTPRSATKEPRLPVGRYRLIFRAETIEKREGFWGSAWRGVLGHALKRLVCVTQLEACEPCLLYRSCVYPYFFVTPPPPESHKLKNYSAAPHPFVLVPHVPDDEGHCVLGVTLFGWGNRYLAYLVHALRQAAARGLKGRTGPMTLEGVEQEAAPGSGQWQSILQGEILSPVATPAPPFPPCPRWVRIRLVTPLRLRLHDDLVTPESFQFHFFFVSLLRRISLLTYFHTEQPLETDFRGIAGRARQVPAESAVLAWKDWTRYSSRQRTKMQLGGLTGSFEVSLEGREEFWPYLWLGQWTHAGKGTSMGLGRYEIDTL
ncbi:MAG: CRISPR system precrRNA processing endoribonuclease RAMP protein Cas6 [Bryobacterales bacterium]|nr:CRISPR system precrRNA processing endoribonuclease RAMP protein Cas6 [Bryobacteraceae bacterium]MDW8355785.1 CRISPR system precrRNA processing endoribonuclease RAMP protein Cas6 [Bryobacterales bacterium]